MDDLSPFCCLAAACPDLGKRGHGNLTVCARYGPHQRRLLYCRSCKARFSERKGTPLFNARLPDDTARAVLAHVADGCGVRQTERLVGVHRDTVMRLTRLAGPHAQRLHDEQVALSPPDDQGPVRREVGLRRLQGEEPAGRRPVPRRPVGPRGARPR
jgi:LacI family transcriptional regulator